MPGHLLAPRLRLAPRRALWHSDRVEGGAREASPAGARRPERAAIEGPIEAAWFSLGDSPLALLLLLPSEGAAGEDFVCTDLTPAAERALGRPRHAMQGRRISEALGRAWSERCAEVWRSGQAQAFAGARLSNGAGLRGVISRSGGALAVHFESIGATNPWLVELAEEAQVPLRGLAAISAAAGPESPESHVREAMGVVEACAASLLGCLGDAVDALAIEGGSIARVREPFAPRASVAAALHPLTVLARAKGIALELAVDADVPEVLRGDPTRLERTLACFVGEALQHTGRGAVRVEVSVEGAMLCAAVEDPGPLLREGGVARRVAERVVALIGGRCAVEARPEGRAAQISWPVEACDEALPAPESRRLRVLVAEDDPLHQVIAVQALERAGHEVVVVDSGWRVLAAAAAGGFDLVALDLTLSELDGAETLQLLRAGEASRVPVAAIVGRATPALRASCAADGFDAVVERPLDLRGLRTLLGLTARPQGERQPK